MVQLFLHWLQLIRKFCVESKGEAALHWINDGVGGGQKGHIDTIFGDMRVYI